MTTKNVEHVSGASEYDFNKVVPLEKLVATLLKKRKCL